MCVLVCGRGDRVDDNFTVNPQKVRPDDGLSSKKS